jgi:hypothetical protein
VCHVRPLVALVDISSSEGSVRFPPRQDQQLLQALRLPLPASTYVISTRTRLTAGKHPYHDRGSGSLALAAAVQRQDALASR